MEEKIRLSCTALCRICNREQMYLLALNQNRLLQGKHVYMAIGGALLYTKAELPHVFGAEPEDAANHELRWFVNKKRLPQFRDWFLARRDRETDPFRELQEELVEEIGIFESLSRDDVKIQYSHTLEVERETDRSGVVGVMTHYFHEIFEVEFINSVKRDKIERIPTTSNLRWVTMREIQAQQLDEELVAVDAQILLRDKIR